MNGVWWNPGRGGAAGGGTRQLLKNLHLSRMAEGLPEELQRAEKEGLAYTDLLLRLVRAQWPTGSVASHRGAAGRAAYNLRPPKVLGLTAPQSLLVCADEAAE